MTGTRPAIDRFFQPLDCRPALRPVVFMARMTGLNPAMVGLATLVVALLGFVEGLALTLLLPLLALLGVETGSDPSGPARTIASVFEAVGIPLSLLPVLGVFLLAGFTQAALHAAQQFLIVRSGESLTTTLRQTLFNLASTASWTHMVRQKGGSLQNAVVSEASRIGLIFGNSVTAFGLILNFAIYIAFAAWLSWKFTLALCILAVVSMVALRGLYRSTRRFGTYTSAALNRMQEILTEHVAGAKFIRTLDAGRFSRSLFASAVRDVGAYMRRNQGNTILVKSTVEPVALIFIAGTIYASVEIIRLPAGELLVLLAIFYRIVPRLVLLQQILQRIIGVMPAYETVSEMMAQLRDAAERTGGQDFSGLRHSIELRDVRLAMDGQTVLDGINLTIPAGRTSALIGPSGGGKSTLLDILTGLRTPDSGEVLFDGLPIEEIELGGLRRRIAVVPQDHTFFHDTIANNLRFAAPEATDEEIWNALRQAHAADYVSAAPDGLDTVIGDQGLRLSGGQRQRLSMARALLRQPDILLLDEPTSALDGDTEAVVRANLAALHGSMTIVVVTHRTALAADVDHVYTIDGGRLALAG